MFRTIPLFGYCLQICKLPRRRMQLVITPYRGLGRSDPILPSVCIWFLRLYSMPGHNFDYSATNTTNPTSKFCGRLLCIWISSKPIWNECSFAVGWNNQEKLLYFHWPIYFAWTQPNKHCMPQLGGNGVISNFTHRQLMRQPKSINCVCHDWAATLTVPKTTKPPI